MTPSCRAGLRLSAGLVLVLPFVVGCGGASLAPGPAKVGGHPSPVSQEDYARVVENPALKVADQPLSTFSAEVNTASYSNVRRFLTEGQLPPADAVRVAELVNYFPYPYPPPADGDPVSLTVDIAPCPWNRPHHLVRIGVQAERIRPEELPPRNLVFLIDTSGSMDGENRLGLVKTALGLLIDRLTAKDVVTVVTYAGDATLWLPPTRGDETARLRAAVNGLQAGGSTNGGGGIQLAYQQARAAFLPDGANRVILCTDGDFNVGVTGEGELVRLIEQQRASGVFLTVLGFGMGNLKNRTMEQLAVHGNGFYAYLDSPSEARKVFVEQGAALVAVAKDVRFQVEFNPAKVAEYRLLGYENRLLRPEEFKDERTDAGDLGAGQTVTALYEVVPVGVAADPRPAVDPLKYQDGKPAPTGSGEWLTVKMRYKHPTDFTSMQLAKSLPGDALARPVGADFRLAAAIAEYGLLLRRSPHRGTASWDNVIAAALVGPDPGGYRAEFVELARTAKRLQAGATRNGAD